jgi:hypothetical protein
MTSRNRRPPPDCALVLEAGGDEDQAIAALLHDAVEDQGGLPTLVTIRHMFVGGLRSSGRCLP